MNTIVYMLTRSDDKKYVGITINMKKRLSDHKRSKRFSLGIKSVEILAECDSYAEAEILETYYVERYDTFNSGLNASVNGKGNRRNAKFTTLGLSYSEESKEKMRKNHWSKTGKYTPIGITHTEEQKKQWSETRKGKCYRTRTIPYDIAMSIKNSYDIDDLTFDNDFISKFVSKHNIPLVGKISPYDLKCVNGKNLSKLKLYSEHYSAKYGYTIGNVRAICKGGVCKDHAKI